MTASDVIAVLIALFLSGCTAGVCAPGEQRECSRDLDGGVTQRGYQACTSRREWSTCVPVGECTGAMATSPLYGRCDDATQCGPDGCGTCGHYAGVQNTEGWQVCFPYCQSDADCAPNSPSSGVTPRCILGQCALLCRTTSTCPRDSQCLRWANAGVGAAWPGFDGLCE